jgi:hypothetical protein
MKKTTKCNACNGTGENHMEAKCPNCLGREYIVQLPMEETIQNKANEIIKSLYTKNGKIKRKTRWMFKGEPINWGNLKCIAVERKYVVYICEAAPNVEEFKNYIKKELEKNGCKDVEIITEW